MEDHVPGRFFIPVARVRPEFVKLSHVHAAFSSWFDHTDREHVAGHKPYAISPLTGSGRGGDIGVEVATFTPEASARFAQAAATRDEVRLGNQTRRVGVPRVLHETSWVDLAAQHSDDAWRLDVVTPMTFRWGDRTSPLPQLETIFGALGHAWGTWSDAPLPGPGVEAAARACWVSTVELTTEQLTIAVRARHPRGAVEVTVRGSVGLLEVRCADSAAAATAGPLLRLAAYTGLGSMTRKGLGVTRVQARSRRRRQPGEGVDAGNSG